jgi:hypothetical protein
MSRVPAILPGSDLIVAGIDPKYYWLTLGLLIFCTLVGMFIIYRLQKDVSEDDLPPTAKEVLGPLERAYYSGLMTEEEFKRINQSMAKQKDGPLPLSKPAKVPMILTETETETIESTSADAEPDTEEDPQA